MGCDIHACLEFNQDGKEWVMIKYLEDFKLPFLNRNYTFFAALAGVRGPGPEPKSYPHDISDGTCFWIKSWGSDSHSLSFGGLGWIASQFHSYCCSKYRDDIDNFMVDYGGNVLEHAADYMLDDELDKPLSQYRIIYWFDN